MKSTTVLATILIVVGCLYTWKQQASAPMQVIDPPDAELQEIVLPVKNVLIGHPNEAKELASFYLEASEVIRRDGLNEKIVKTNSNLRTFCQRAVTLRFKGIFVKIPGLADAIHGKDGVMATVLGLEASEFDYTKAADAFHAIAWACQEAE